MTLSIVEQKSPLDYHGHHPTRLALVDPTAGPPKSGDSYFAGRTKTVTHGAGGKKLKKPRTEVTPGAGEGVVAFVDFDVMPDWLVVHYVTTRDDQRGKGHMRRLLDTLLERHGSESQYVSFGDVYSESAWRYIKELEKRPDMAGRVRAKMRFNPDAEDGKLWTSGACGTFAAVLHRLTGLPIYATLWTAPDDQNCVELVHAFVMTPDGSRLDADGVSKAPPLRVVERVWEAGIGDDSHPDTGEKGQWWNEETRRLTLAQLAQVRAASEDVNDPGWQAKAEVWIERNASTFAPWLKKRRNSDERRRRAERRVAAGGAVEDDARVLVERVRAGELGMDRVEAAASLGHLAARMLTPVPLVELPGPDGEWGRFASAFVGRFPLECVLLMIEIERVMLHFVRWHTHDPSWANEENVDNDRCTDQAHLSMTPGTCPRSRFLPGEIAYWNAMYDEMRRALLAGRRPSANVEVPSSPDIDDAPLWGHWDLYMATWAVEEIADRGLEAFAREESSGDRMRKFREVLTLFHCWSSSDHEPLLESRPAWIAQHLAALILNPPAVVARRNPRKNMDERRRKLERRARASGSLEDAARAAVDAERTDGQARRIERMVTYAVWRVGEVMSPRNPGLWENNSEHVTSKKVAELVLRAATGQDGQMLRDVASEQFQQRRLCVEERHDEPCVYDGCAACEEECVPPDESGGAPRYDLKTASALIMAGGDELVIGIMATPSFGGPSGSGGPLRMLQPRELAEAMGFHGASAWEAVRNQSVTLDQYEEDLVDTDNVRVWDNGGRTADRFTILMQGEIPRGDDDGEPFYLTINSSRHPSHPQGIWMRDTEAPAIDMDNTSVIGVEQEPWTELLPRPVLDAIWDERGHARVRVPRDVAGRWAILKLTGYFD